MSRGWITFASILLKSLLTITAALILICTTGMDKLAAGLRMLKVPRLFVLQLLLTYRYISVLIEEVSRSIRAYKLRAPSKKAFTPVLGERSLVSCSCGPLTGRRECIRQCVYVVLQENTMQEPTPG